MTKRLFAGYEFNGYEFAIWAENKAEIAKRLAMPGSRVRDSFSDQSTNKPLKALLTDRTKAYRRKLEDGAEWEAI